MTTGTGTASWCYCAKCGRSHPNTTAGCDYTAPIAPNAKAVSYAVVLRNAAEHADIRARDAVGPRTAAHYSAEAAALRALAALVERAKQINNGRGTDVHPTWNAAMGLMEALAAGYTPPEDGPR